MHEPTRGIEIHKNENKVVIRNWSVLSTQIPNEIIATGNLTYTEENYIAIELNDHIWILHTYENTKRETPNFIEIDGKLLFKLPKENINV